MRSAPEYGWEKAGSVEQPHVHSMPVPYLVGAATGCVMAAISQHNTDNAASSLVQLREGTEDAPLFLFSGGDGNPRALAPLASRMRDFRALVGVDFSGRDDDGELPTIETMARRSFSAIRTVQPHGPYHLAGYSFGGLVAIEVARLLQESGEDIALMGLIDTMFDQRFWPTHVFLRSQARLIRRYLGILVGLPLNQMLPMLSYRCRRLLLRFVRRQMPSSVTAPIPKAETENPIERHCRAMMSNYRPRYFAGKITSFDAASHEEYGCDPAELWQGLATEIERWTIAGTHVGVVSDSVSLAELAAAIDARLAACPPSRPRPGGGC